MDPRGRSGLRGVEALLRLNSHQARWALFFGRFKFSLSYHPGFCNTKPDALSRLHSVDEGCSELDSILPPTCILASLVWKIESLVTQAQAHQADPGTGPPGRLFVPDAVHSDVLQWDHPHPGFPAPSVLVAYHGLRHPVFRRRLCHLCKQQDFQQTSVWTASPAAYPQSSVVQHRA